MATLAEMESAYQINVRNLRAAHTAERAADVAKIASLNAEIDTLKARVATLEAKGKSDLDAAKAAAQSELDAAKAAAKAALDAANAECDVTRAECDAARAKLAEAVVAAGGLETMRDIVRQHKLREAMARKASIEANLAAEQKRIEELNAG